MTPLEKTKFISDWILNYVNSMPTKAKSLVIGISGGIDSALSASLACDSLGKKNVMGVFLPTKFTSRESLKDSEMLCKNLDIKLEHVNIESVSYTHLTLPTNREV